MGRATCRFRLVALSAAIQNTRNAAVKIPKMTKRAVFKSCYSIRVSVDAISAAGL